MQTDMSKFSFGYHNADPRVDILNMKKEVCVQQVSALLIVAGSSRCGWQLTFWLASYVVWLAYHVVVGALQCGWRFTLWLAS